MDIHIATEAAHVASSTWLTTSMTLLLPTMVAFLSWAATRLQRRGVLRSSYLAQLQSLKVVVDGELSFLEDADQDYTWFPILPFFSQGDGPLAAVGLLSREEVTAIVAATSTYRERLAYIAGYTTPRQTVAGVDGALGLSIRTGAKERDLYKYDLCQIKREVDSAHEILFKTSLSQWWRVPEAAFRAGMTKKRPTIVRQARSDRGALGHAPGRDDAAA